jgi:type I restriction enzyme R subunit
LRQIPRPTQRTRTSTSAPAPSGCRRRIDERRSTLSPRSRARPARGGLARRPRAAASRGEELGLTDEEVAFYDALGTKDSAVAVLGDETLRTITRELAETVKKNATIDWNQKESVRAAMRVAVKRTLRRHGYPPDKQEKATALVLEQAEQLGLELAV